LIVLTNFFFAVYCFILIKLFKNLTLIDIIFKCVDLHQYWM
jgi:hypothetical protein